MYTIYIPLTRYIVFFITIKILTIINKILLIQITLINKIVHK